MIFKGLQNDHKAVMVEIEEALHKLHATARVREGKDETKMEATGQTVSLSSPFALVDAVTQGSPAFQAVSLCPQSAISNLLMGPSQNTPCFLNTPSCF